MSEGSEKSLAIVGCVQRSMRPHWSRVSDVYAYSCRIHPKEQVSHNLLEWYRPTEETSLAIFGDVPGRGTDSALAMIAIQAFLKQFKHVDVVTARRIHVIAAQVHDFIMENLMGVAHMPATFVFADFAAKRVHYLNCGNPEPFIARLGEGVRREVKAKGPGAKPLGLDPQAKYTREDIVEIPFAPGDAFIQYTGGFLTLEKEGPSPIPQAELDRLCSEAVKNQCGCRAAFCELPYRLVDSLSKAGYSIQRDDMTVCAFSPFDPPDGESFLTRVRMRPENIDAACRKASEWAAAKFKSDELGVKTDLILNEHLMNIHRHGYDAFRRQREVCVLFMAEREGKLEIYVWDRGFPWEETASLADAEAKLERQNDNLAGNGRGQAIMLKLADSITHRRVADLNLTVFAVKA